jgi:hypothetical protein
MAGVAELNSKTRSYLVANEEHFQVSVPRMGKDNNSDSDVRFDHAPYFKFNDGKVKFDTNYVDNANDNYGAASGLVPKSPFIKKVSLWTPFVLLICT